MKKPFFTDHDKREARNLFLILLLIAAAIFGLKCFFKWLIPTGPNDPPDEPLPSWNAAGGPGGRK